MKYTILLLISFLIACSSKPHTTTPDINDIAIATGDIYIVSHGWHTGIIIPADLIQSRIPEIKNRFTNAKFLEFGWGDKGFYQANEITSGLTLQAIFWPTEAVMHVVSVPHEPTKFFPSSHMEKVCLDDAGYSALVRFIENSFYKDGSGNVISTRMGLYGDSQFYQAVGDYYLMNTCNKWTAKALKSAGMDISPMFKLSAGSVMDFVTDNHRSNLTGSCFPKP